MTQEPRSSTAVQPPRRYCRCLGPSEQAKKPSTMSIIIRLQNLPWAANSLDIRRYFQGLNIPEGGVHIVGGEKGDAFIAFGSDEDARQAMERDGGKIKEVRIKLLLSSRAEMQRIIDQARAQHTAPPPVKKEERRRPSPDDRSRRPPRDRSPRRRSSRRDRSHSRSPPYRRDKDRSRSSRSDERRRSFDDPGRVPEPSKVSNGQASERKGWDEKPPYTDPSKTAPPIFPIGNMNQVARPQSEVNAAPVNMACQPAALPNLAAFNLPPVGLMSNLGLPANMMGGLMGAAGGDMMGGMTANMGEGVPANVASSLPSGLAGQIGGGMAGSMAANMAGGMPGNVTGGVPAAIPGGLAGNIPGSMPGHMGGMSGAAGGMAANVSGGMAAGMPGNMAANMPGAFGMGDAMGVPNNMESIGNMAPGFVDRRLDGGGKADRKSDGGPPGGAREVPRHAEESCCVELRGLSGAPTPRDVKDLFRGLRIFSGCIRVATSETGIKSVVVRFANKWDAREAIQGDYKILCGDPIQVVPFPEDLFEQTELLVSPSAVPPNQGRSRESDMVVVMKGLPYNTSEQDVLQFFSGLNVLDIFVEHERSGRATGMAFVEFGDKRDFETAMSMQRRKIGHRYIELSVGSRDVMYAARNGDNIRPDGMPPSRRDEEPPVAHGVGPDRAPEVGHGPGPMHGPGMGAAVTAHGPGHSLVPPGHTCVSMLGLPNTVTDRDIADFFSTQGVIPRAIHIMLGANGVPTGHAFAEFATHADCERAFLQDGANLGPHVIALKTIPYSEVAQALGGHHRPDGRPDGRPDNRYDNRFDGRFDARLHDRGGDGRPERPGMRPEGRFEPGPPGPPPRERDGPPKRPLLERSSRPPLFPEAGPRRGPLFPDRGGPLPDRGGPLPDRGGPLPDRGGPLPERGGPIPERGGPLPERGGPIPERGGPIPERGGPLPERGGPLPERGGPLLRAPRHEEPPTRGMDSFGKPGCVVTATNIPYRAGVEDIINFFQGYELTKENVMRRFNDRGQATGDARIAFPTPRDAQEALSKFNNRPMHGRAISLGIL
ncbi:RNA-binding protein 12 isoform X3 [Dermacentor albipictus]|uniref:RNA-binding protein 12 isoform X3 n=1 Tax=Dermacentor albipictus TaxID=60249 RepID=UPI0031FDF9F8